MAHSTICPRRARSVKVSSTFDRMDEI
jgi:hypothetical protein